jgi:hypothetical protein
MEKEWKSQFGKRVELTLVKKRFELGFGLFLGFLVMILVRANFVDAIYSKYEVGIRIAFDYFYFFVMLVMGLYGGYLISNSIAKLREMGGNG